MLRDARSTVEPNLYLPPLANSANPFDAETLRTADQRVDSYRRDRNLIE
jgi:hypothetical protein